MLSGVGWIDRLRSRCGLTPVGPMPAVSAIIASPHSSCRSASSLKSVRECLNGVSPNQIPSGAWESERCRWVERGLV